MAALECLSLKTWSLEAFALNAGHTVAQVRARLLDLLILAIMGFVVMGCGRYALVGYAEDDEDFFCDLLKQAGAVLLLHENCRNIVTLRLKASG